MEFGIFIGGATYKDVVPKIVVATEKSGYHSFWVSDHLFLPDHFYKAVGMSPEKGESPLLEAWTTMAAAAALTKRVKLG
ncbi:MAG: LLM class flavin-dependent oxidoreductase, partial [Candidatus Bathyarchaeia archaeon]